MKTISFLIDDEIAKTIKKEAEENFTSVSQYMKKLMTEKYKGKSKSDK